MEFVYFQISVKDEGQYNKLNQKVVQEVYNVSEG